jgi:formate-dependent phosphoribosylglycinamide formyltransferase (GAR transformylase)
MLVANTNEEKIVFKETSPLNPDMIVTLDIKFLAEFALSMKALLKDNKYQSLSINYT